MAAKYLDSNDTDRIFTMAKSINGSPIWKFIWERRNIITKYLTWKIGNGGKAKFWRDSWNGDISLAKEIDDLVWVNEVEALVAPFVADYILQGQKEAEWIEWKTVGEWKMENSIKLKDILSRKKKIRYQKEVDCLLWCASKSRKYKVNLGYKILRSRAQNVDWPSAFCWHKMVLPKAGTFLWKPLHGRILTGERLKLIGIVGLSVCILCKENEETADHLLFCFSYTKRVWDWLLDKL
ncbi:hypothetical protein SUGI_0512150 [Cryptomeria japonica]|uniref:uncharacterized protein LOC131061142 n=1 Tax=Cryptomeria japonica TaxID=3369 RepID=UPI0024089DE9|nr:uncharacterized protein LOC131061142 [Cryptomeria japonica]GLJ26502.1 hypothetical protein SUGI_0512150 [Cryptomeria japonica]